MKRTALEKHLRKQGCRFVRSGGKHDVWGGPEGRQSSLSRSKNVKTAAVKSLCKQLGVSPPTSFS